jgi:phospholipase C
MGGERIAGGILVGLVAATAFTGVPASARRTGGTELTARRAITAATATPITHVVVIMEENHSFDNYFGTYPGANGIPAAACAPDPATAGCDRPFHMIDEYPTGVHARPAA